MEKVIRGGNVAILVSQGFGAGWFTWNDGNKELLFHPKLVELVESDRQSEITESFIESELGIKDVYCGGAKKLKVFWLKEGTAFKINEYDGNESIETLDDLTLIA